MPSYSKIIAVNSLVLYFLFLQDPHWTLFSDHCAPCLTNFTFIVDLDNRQELVDMLRITGLEVVMKEDEEDMVTVNPTLGGSSSEVVMQYMEMLECQEIEDLVKIYQPDFTLFNYTINSVLPSNIECSFE